MTGLVFVFTPALGEFVIPDLLGGARVMLIGNLITDQFLRARDWPFGSALSLLLILLVSASLLDLLSPAPRFRGGRGVRRPVFGVFGVALTWLAFFMLYLPLGIMLAYSFIDPRSRTAGRR